MKMMPDQIRFFKKQHDREMSIQQIVDGVIKKNIAILAKALTIIESKTERHREQAQTIIQQLLPYAGRSIRIGITGVPGAGKSSFIEGFGMMLCDAGFRVAVLAIDPSSTITGGSILGDKTRMEALSKHVNAFIRPSPSSGTLGGVHERTREAIIACEAAGYDIILVETVGVGQSEVTVRSMVDFFLLLVLTRAGDELQGIKKGILELADALIVHKADGDNLSIAEQTRREYKQILHLIHSRIDWWKPQVLLCSSITGKGWQEIWSLIEGFIHEAKIRNYFETNRQFQVHAWFHSLVMERLERSFFQNKQVIEKKKRIDEQLENGEITVPQAVDLLFSVYNSKKNGQR